jgi:signal transduction histidine kinase
MKKIIAFIFLLVCQQTFSQNRDSILQIINANKKDTNTVKALRTLAGISNAEKTREAIAFGLRGAELGKQLNWSKGIAGCYLNTGYQYNILGQLDSVLFYADSAIKYSLLAGDANRLALVYLNKADAYMQLKVFANTLTLCDTAMQYAKQAKNDDRLARIFMTIGSVYLYQKIYDKALTWYIKANALFVSINNNNMSAIVMNNIANTYNNNNQLDSARIYYAKAIEIGERLKDFNQLPLYYGGLGETLTNSGNFEEAFIYCKKSLDIALSQEQVQHISTAYLKLGDLFLKKKDYEQSIEYSLSAYNIALRNNNLDDRQHAANTLAVCYEKIGNYQAAFHYMQIDKLLSDSLNKLEFEEQIVTKQTIFEVSQKENQIKLLNNEKALREKEIDQKKLLILLLIVAFIAATIIGFVLWNRYRLKQRLKEVEIRNKIASDLHDDVGSTLSSIRMYSDIVSNQVKETNPSSIQLLDKISSNSKEMIENMSDIVWMIKPGNDDFKSIENRMLNFANELCVPAGINFEFTKNGFEEGIKMPMEMRRDLYLIFKEAINNAVKYSGCHSINAAINCKDHQLEMHISDDGNGFDINTIKKGNGLSNMQKRTAAHGGTFTITSSAGEGTEITVTFNV